MCNGSDSKLDKQEKIDNYNSAITNNLIMTIANSNGIQQMQSPSPPSSIPYQMTQPQTDDPPYIICPREIPDPHTIGLPINNSDEDFNKQSQYSVVQDWKNEWIDKYKTHDIQYRPYTVSANSTYTLRNDRILSPYESWTASQLLQGHEQRHHNNGDICHNAPDSDNLSLIQKTYYKCEHPNIADLESNSSDKGLVNSIIDTNHMHSSPVPYMPYNTKTITPNANLSFIHDRQIYSNDYVDNSQIKHNNRAYATMLHRSPEEQLRHSTDISSSTVNASLQGSLSSVCGNDPKKKTRNITMV